MISLPMILFHMRKQAKTNNSSHVLRTLTIVYCHKEDIDNCLFLIIVYKSCSCVLVFSINVFQVVRNNRTDTIIEKYTLKYFFSFFTFCIIVLWLFSNHCNCLINFDFDTIKSRCSMIFQFFWLRISCIFYFYRSFHLSNDKPFVFLNVFHFGLKTF